MEILKLGEDRENELWKVDKKLRNEYQQKDLRTILETSADRAGLDLLAAAELADPFLVRPSLALQKRKDLCDRKICSNVS